MLNALRIGLLVAFFMVWVTCRRLFEGPRHALWSWRAEVAFEVLRYRTRKVAGLSPDTLRARIPPAPMPLRLPGRIGVADGVLAGLPTRVFTPGAWEAEQGATLLYFHGGGYVVCNTATHQDLTARLASTTGARVISVDYGLAPEHPFPEPIDDGVAAYRAILEEVDPRRLIIGGDSAGGGLALATLLTVQQASEPMPAAAILMSPWVDLTLEGASLEDNAHLCYLDRPTLQIFVDNYLQGADPTDPLASPVHAALSGMPPTMILTGTAEAFFSENQMLAERARQAGVEVELYLGEGMVHAWPAYAPILPEGRAALLAVGDFVRGRLA